MRNKLLTRSGIGFLLGMVMLTLIVTLTGSADDGTIHFVSETLLHRAGNARAAALLQLLVCGLYGALCMGGTLLYEIEHWPLLAATAVHYLMIALSYALMAALLGWEMTPSALLTMEGLMAVGFLLIWLIMYLRYKAEVRELNTLMEKT